jgi:hypothetical protein
VLCLNSSEKFSQPLILYYLYSSSLRNCEYPVHVSTGRTGMDSYFMCVIGDKIEVGLHCSIVSSTRIEWPATPCWCRYWPIPGRSSWCPAILHHLPAWNKIARADVVQIFIDDVLYSIRLHNSTLHRPLAHSCHYLSWLV